MPKTKQERGLWFDFEVWTGASPVCSSVSLALTLRPSSTGVCATALWFRS